jgi:tetratricopeptide (TPR) repeat protein
MMPEHKYVSERVERKTHIKGTFKGKFEGRLDPYKSDVRYERFFDIDIVDGDIFTTPNNLHKWSDEVDLEAFTGASSFAVKGADGIRVTLQSTDSTEKYFKLKLKELKLINCRLSQQTYVGNMVYGLLEGDVLSYMLHTDTYVNEVEKGVFEAERILNAQTSEKQQEPVRIPGKETINQEPQKKYQIGDYWPFLKRFLLVLLMIVLVLLVQSPFLTILTLVLGLLMIVRWLGKLRRGSRRPFFRRLFSPGYILLYVFVGLLLVVIYGIRSDGTKTGPVAEVSRKKVPLTFKVARHQKDSFEHHLKSGKDMLLERSNDKALAHFEKASEFASQQEAELVNNETNSLYTSLAEGFEKEKQYKQAIEVYSNLVNNNPSNPTFLYNRALCYIKMKDMPGAVKDLKKAIDLGDEPARLLHDQINPLKRKVAYTVIRCRDGSVSNSKHRRGTCSHHGGVENWNEEVYEEYREYQ